MPLRVMPVGGNELPTDETLTNGLLYEARPLTGANGNPVIWENASNHLFFNLQKRLLEATFFWALGERPATAGKRWPGEKRVNNHLATGAAGFDSACSGSSGTENSRSGSVDRVDGGPNRKSATTPRAIPIAARRASWPSRLFLSMPQFCERGSSGKSGESSLPKT